MVAEWCAVLPDGDAALAAARALCPSARHVVEHASGRPWIVGCWPDGWVTVRAAGGVRLAVVGQRPVRGALPRERVAGLRSVDEVEEALAGVPGCFHAVASIGGRVCVRGSLSSVRRVFHARYGGCTVAADSARVLARLTGAGWEPEWVALRLASGPPDSPPSAPSYAAPASAPSAPLASLPSSASSAAFPLHESTPWRGVRPVPGDRRLVLERDGTAAERCRWVPPEPEVPLKEGAVGVRRALDEAVRARTAAGGTVGGCLSGGLAEVGLAFLAGRSAAAELVTYRWAARGTGGPGDHGGDGGDGGLRDGAGGDGGGSPVSGGLRGSYAESAAADLPNARHRVGPWAGWVGPCGGPADDVEQPLGWGWAGARLAHAARTTGAGGARVHLSGCGGEALFRAGPGYVHDLLRRGSPAVLRHAAVHRRAVGAPWAAVLRSLAEGRTPAAEAALHADGLVRTGGRDDSAGAGGAGHSGGACGAAAPGLDAGWAPVPRMPSWATEGAAEAARDLLRAAARGPVEALAPGRAQHRALLAVRAAGAAVGRADAAWAAHGWPRLAAPYLDDRVIEAALAVRPRDVGARGPGPGLPLLADALRGIVPEPLLRRAAGGDAQGPPSGGSAPGALRALHRYRAELPSLFDGSELARHGLVDDAAVRRAPSRPCRGAAEAWARVRELEATVACERWLRALREGGGDGAGGDGGAPECGRHAARIPAWSLPADR